MYPDLFPGLKNKVFYRRNSNLRTVRETEDDKSLAVVLWASKGRIVEESMDTKVAEGSPIEVEKAAEQTTVSTGFGVGGEVFQQCHQHCMAPPISGDCDQRKHGIKEVTEPYVSLYQGCF
ncbi:hypothetical protein DsansV1_C21g0169871 [Dioscorea sansibarensis]